MWPQLSWGEGSASTTRGNGCPHSADGEAEALSSAEVPRPNPVLGFSCLTQDPASETTTLQGCPVPKEVVVLETQV